MTDNIMEYSHVEMRLGMHLQAYGIDPNPSIEAMRALGAELVLAYDQAVFECSDPRATVTLLPGKLSSDLDMLLTKWRAESWCFVTACNPRSELMDAKTNEERQKVLGDVLRLSHEHVFSAVGRAKAGDWEEPSYLVLGISIHEAAAVAIVFGQNAVLIGQLGGPAELLFL